MPLPNRNWASRVSGWIHRSVEAAVVILFLAMLAVGFAQILNRFFLGTSLSWSEEFQRFAHIWIIFLAIPIGYRRGVHIGVDLLESALSLAAARRLAFVIDIGWLVLGIALVITTQTLMQVARRQTVPSMGITMDYIYLGLVIGGVYLVFVAASRILTTLFPQTGERAS